MLSDLSVVPLEDPARSEKLAERLGLSLCSPESVSTDLYLGYLQQKLCLFQGENPKAPVFVDFPEWHEALRRTNGYSAKSLLARALGVERGSTVWDVTAGLGGDTLVFCGLGMRVTALERSSVVYELLLDGYHRACEKLDFLANLRIENADAVEYFKSFAGEAPDVIYLDPMYPEKKKSSLPKKEMQVLQKLLGPDTAVEEIFREAIKLAKVRVVLKRPLDAPDAFGRPTHSFRGKSVRYDMFVTGNN